MNISYNTTIKSNQLKLIELSYVLNSIREDFTLKSKIDQLRQLPELEQQNFKINELPYFSMGTFEHNIRKKENLISIQTLILDIDHLDQDQLLDLKSKLINDPEMYFLFTSPSGNGLKIAVKMDQEITDPEQYERVYRAYASLFSLRYEVEGDTHTCDASRACFLSSDPDLYFNENSQAINTIDMLTFLKGMEVPGSKMSNELTSTDGLNLAIEFLINKNNEIGAIYNSYTTWQLLGLSLASLGEAGRQHFLKLTLSNIHFQDNEITANLEFDKLLRYYGRTNKNTVGIGTLFYIAQKNGYLLDNGQEPDENINQISNPSKEFDDALREISQLKSETEREIKLRALSTKKGVSLRTLKSDLKRVTDKSHESIISDEKIILTHPAYDIKDGFLTLGFKETLVVNNIPVDRNLFLVTKGTRFYITQETFLKIDDLRVVFDLRDRELININDRWSKNDLDLFLSNPISPFGLYEKIKTVLKDYIDFQKEEYFGIVTAWIIMTYFHRCFFAVPYLYFFGKKQTAKSRGLELLEKLSFNAIKVKGTSVASFVDSADGLRSSFLTDQAESLSDLKNSEIVGYHADSYTIGGGKRRIVQIVNGKRRILSFQSYCPKAYASQKDIDSDLQDRCIIIPMIRTDKEFPYPSAHLPIWPEIRKDLYRLLITKWKEVQEIYPQTGKDLSMRIRELWQPLETVLILEKVSLEEIESLKKVFLMAMVTSQDTLTDREELLFEVLFKLTEPQKLNPNGLSLSSSDIGSQMKSSAHAVRIDLGFDKDRGLFTWIGTAIKRLSLSSQPATSSNIRKHQYVFKYDHIKSIYNKFQPRISDRNQSSQG
jgi:hypothetical protein